MTGPRNSIFEKNVSCEIAVPGHLVTNQGTVPRSLQEKRIKAIVIRRYRLMTKTCANGPLINCF